jgi:hypothetical protein
MDSIIDQVRAAVSILCLYLTFYRPTRDIFDDELVQYVLRDYTSYFSTRAPATLKFASPQAFGGGSHTPIRVCVKGGAGGGGGLPKGPREKRPNPRPFCPTPMSHTMP